MNQEQLPQCEINQDTLSFSGLWTTVQLHPHMLDEALSRFSTPQTLTCDFTQIQSLDTNGACLLRQLIKKLEAASMTVQVTYRDEEQKKLLSLVESDMAKDPIRSPPDMLWLPAIGKETLELKKQLLTFIAFLGQISESAWFWLKNPSRIRWTSIIYGIDNTGYKAIGIVALLSFLIGVVLCYQMGIQLESYGATIYVVDLMGISVLREFAPLLTAIIVAGRTGSAFAAQIGTMKLNQEIDALNTFGLSAMEYLVLPKIVALLIALPLLTVLSMVSGVLGGMIMAKLLFSITYLDFLSRFGDVISVKVLVLGMIKTPVFAVLIASIGCFQGMQVTNGAESVGARTTISVVHAIFMIIISDAFFSILYSKLGL